MKYVDGIARAEGTHHALEPVHASRSIPLPSIGWALAFLLIGAACTAVALAGDVRTMATLRSLVPPGHYLVLFQNNAELRPSGGFLGSFATVDITKTGYENLRIDTNIYKRDNAFTARTKIDPPEPLLGVAADNAWAMRDSNWDLDFRDAAERVSWFYEQEAGEPVDGVIAVNATVLQDLLTVTGPLPLPNSDDELTAENFFDTLHYKIEKEYFHDPDARRLNEPKSILRDLVPTLQRALVRLEVASQLVPLGEQQLAERHIQLFHTDLAVEQKILAAGWGGALADTDDDYLLINNASVGGRKSSLNMIQEVALTLRPTAAGTAHTLLITRRHTGDGVWPDHTNNNYTRVVVPATATLTAASLNGEDVTDEVTTEHERGKTVFGHHLDTPAGETSELELTYTTSSGLRSFYYQKQSGILTEHLTVVAGTDTLFDRQVTTDTTVSLQ